MLLAWGCQGVLGVVLADLVPSRAPCKRQFDFPARKELWGAELGAERGHRARSPMSPRQDTSSPTHTHLHPSSPHLHKEPLPKHPQSLCSHPERFGRDFPRKRAPEPGKCVQATFISPSTVKQLLPSLLKLLHPSAPSLAFPHQGDRKLLNPDESTEKGVPGGDGIAVAQGSDQTGHVNRENS